MELSGSPSDLAMLRTFSPLQAMKAENLVALARKSTRREAPMGRVLIREGDDAKQTFYLLKGTVDLMQEGEVIASIAAGTPKAKNPLGHALPRAHSAVSTSNRVEYLVIDSEFLDVMVTWEQTGSYEVSELRGSGDEPEESPAAGDWMTALLQTKAFHKVPPANIQAVFMRMQRVDYRTNEVVIRQGDAGDYFYVVVKGTCAVTRDTPLNKDGVRLAELKMGDSFG